MKETAEAAFAEVVSGSGPLSRISFSVGDLPEVTGDAVLLRLVWHNLLSNAVKFSGERLRAEIRVEGSVSGEEAVFRVCDNGIGLATKDAAHLFDVFHRLHEAGEFEGTGVGLALVRRIVTRHGGRVWAEGEPFRGATFSFSLPLKLQGAMESNPAETAR